MPTESFVIVITVWKAVMRSARRALLGDSRACNPPQLARLRTIWKITAHSDGAELHYVVLRDSERRLFTYEQT